VGNLYLAPGRDRITKMNGCIANKITARKCVGRAKSGQLLEAFKLKASPG